MTTCNGIFLKTEQKERLFEQAKQHIHSFQQRADTYDETGNFPFENFEDLRKQQWLSFTVPKEYGGEGATLSEFVLVQETIAQGDAATALCLGWHNGTLMQLRDTRKWRQETFADFCHQVSYKQILVNSAATEPNSGSPARGGKPQTTATYNNGKWYINGTKSFVSLAPALDYAIVTATIEETGEVGEFLLSLDQEGVYREETWNPMSMRATRSDHLILEGVTATDEAFVAKKGQQPNVPQGWLLHIPACYLGIAIAARNDAVQFAETYQPASLNTPIKDVEDVRRRIAEMDVELMKARHMMYHIAERWDEDEQIREQLAPELATVKTVATNAAVDVVDRAMRIVGAQGLLKSQPFQRYYRDVRAGLHNPPGDDLTYRQLAKRAFGEV
ncbi:acyl-CoA dehydrogenase family protein [Texcoconibacillus texcoconensis]|uniref:Alkylation response protein AidB-like acyl-CoA dehydrogenase n=1 Tax=Texcoconibacillus texcoconensis TaxID=1095777 RepID=A0A840QTS7_9BACI|nr:acyl-CoA dehydrogenase family protein [Texcoconibacillus texcoconensis]MBB5174699.1 alkylation response protein AidB-like acyl-CoA dehydrogenase [Texcoconibacillus texcoconensis]